MGNSFAESGKMKSNVFPSALDPLCSSAQGGAATLIGTAWHTGSHTQSTNHYRLSFGSRPMDKLELSYVCNQKEESCLLGHVALKNKMNKSKWPGHPTTITVTHTNSPITPIPLPPVPLGISLLDNVFKEGTRTAWSIQVLFSRRKLHRLTLPSLFPMGLYNGKHRALQCHVAVTVQSMTLNAVNGFAVLKS